MEPNESYNPGSSSVNDDPETRSAVNSLILDYYKKFGRKRDLEQFFSLSTAQTEIRDPSSLFWRKMKAQHDSSDSGDKPSESSTELCRISIKCSVPEQSSSSTMQEKPPIPKYESESPPIIIEELVPTERLSDDDSNKSDGNNSQKSADATLDTSLNKPLSPTSSVTSQRKLEWDSLADVGYANEIDRKTSGSSLSTLERLALQQQYTNSDNQESGNLGQPSAHSTLLDTKQEPKKTNKKNLVKKTREIHQTEIDTVEVSVPHTAGNMPISVNLTKHISFNVERDNGVTVECNEKDISVNPEQKNSVETKMSPEVRFDKQIQTSFTKSKSSTETSESNNKKKTQQGADTGPVLITLNTLRRKIKRRKRRTGKKKPISKRQCKTKPQDRHPLKGTEQVSEAESFEYMPGHIYNQNQMKDGHQKTRNSAGNKSSLESSGGITTESSNSFTKDLEKSIKLLNEVLQRHNDDSHLKKQLVKDVVRKLIKSDYKDDESATEFLSGLSYNSKRLDLSKASHNYTTTSTSDMNNSGDTARRPKKSILRMDKFDSKALASNSQSAPNLPSVSASNVPVITKLNPLINIESDASCGKSFLKTSSEEIYKKYLEALRKEEAYKKHLKDKNDFLKQKLVGSDTALKVPEVQIPAVKPNKLKDLIKDLIRNNYDDGSGDASKLEGGPSSSNRNFLSNSEIRKQRNHSVFTLSSGNSDRKCVDRENRKLNLRKRLQDEIEASSSSNEGTSKAAMRREHFCCCPHHTSRCGFTDSSTQVNIDYCQNCDKRKAMTTNSCPCKMSHDIGGVQISCSEKTGSPRKYQVQYAVDKSSDLDTQKEFDNRSKDSFEASVQCSGSRKTTPSSSPRVAFTQKPEITKPSTSHCAEFLNVHPHRAIKASDEVIFQKWGQLTRKMSQSSQTNVAINIFTRKLDNKFCDCNNPMCIRKCSLEKSFTSTNLTQALNTVSGNTKIHETTRSLQTEISIDPKISDPQLHDIVIVNSEDLVQVISEHYREVSRSKLSETNDVELKYFKTYKDSETQFGTDTDIYNYMSPRVDINSVNSLTCGRTQTYMQDNGRQTNLESVKQVEQFRLPSEFKIDTDSYAIPLEGTNMTLRVSIGTKDVKNTEPKPNKAEKSEKCYPPRVKHPPNVFGALSDRSSCKESTIPINIEEKSDKVEKSAMTNDCCENKQKASEKPSNKYPTYPCVEKKQFFRTNTHPILEKKSVANVTEKEPMKQQEKKVCHIDTQADIPTEEKNIETLKLVSMPVFEKPDCTVDAEPLHKGETGFDAYSNSLDYEVENPNMDSTYPRKTDAAKTKLRDENPDTQSKAPEKFDCNDYVNISYKKAGISISHSQPSSMEEKFDAQNKNNGKTKTHEGNRETAASLPTSARSTCSDPVMEKIQEITKRYGKKDLDKGKRKKCFNEIISVLNYLLETEDKPNFEKQECVQTASSNDTTDVSASCSKTTQDTSPPGNKLLTKCTKDSSTGCSPKQFIDRAIQLTQRKSRNKLSSSESSDLPTSSDIQECSTDLATCKILNKIKKECEKYHNKRCKSQHNARCDSSSTTVHCGDCKKAPHCLCRTTKCKCKITSPFQRLKKKCVAYNLILQTSESMMSDGQGKDEESKRELKNIVVKVPKRCCKPLPEYQSYLPHKYEQSQTKAQRPKSPTEEVPATDDYKKAHSLTVKEYLEKNRPDFIESATQRQSCLKMMEEHRATERALHKRLLSMQLQRQSALKGVSATQLRQLARELGLDTRRGAPVPKFMSEREMKKHSEKIYKKLPEQMRKKEDLRNENTKKTNLLMARIFKKNLQKKTLRGSVNLSNYNTVIKI